MELTDQQQHLKACLEQQKALIDEMQSLQSQTDEKRALALKLQGIIEYLQGQGVELPKEEPEAAPEAEAPAASDE
jgi:peptidoglycan hydrolase CwlO-like protein